MKTKNRFWVKTFAVIACLALSLFAGVMAFSYTNRDNILKAVFNSTSDFSGIDENNLVLQVEKVGVIAGQDLNTTLYQQTLNEFDDVEYVPLSTYLYGGGVEASTDPWAESNKYYYQPVRNGLNSKYVVYDGDFVMLMNNQDGDNFVNSSITTTYYNSGTAEDPTYTQATMQEAIAISFGQFVGTDGGYQITNEDLTSNISMVSQTTIYRNGELVEVPLRSYSSNYIDFSLIIPQSSENEGHWQINLSYTFNGQSYSESFDFYLVFNTSYTGSVSDNGSSYLVSPNIRLDGSTLVQSNSSYQYFLGNSSTQSYPVLTYDYTKYHISYSVTANGETTNYDYTLSTSQTDNVGGGVTTIAQLVCTMTGAETGTRTYTLGRFNANRTNNLVSIVLSEMGDYVFNYEYIYTINNENTIMDNLTIPTERLNFAGVEINYSDNRTDAQMRYITFSNNNNLQYVDLIIPNGYTSSESTLENGFLYELNTSSSARVGSVVSSTGGNYNSRLNNYISNNPGTVDNVNSLANYINSYVAPILDSAETPTVVENSYLTNWLNYLNNNNAYARTNQGPINFTTNDDYDWNRFALDASTSNNAYNSFYLYSSTPLTSSTRLPSAYRAFTRQTNFDTVGYYLVFIRLSTSSGYFGGNYIVFAFQYNTDTSGATVRSETSNRILHADDYTNENIVVSWQERGVFERQVTVNYRTSQTKESFNSNAVDITNRAELNSGVYSYTISLGSGYMHYQININIEGLSTVSTVLTIDKEPISGIVVNEVEQYTTVLGNTSYQYVLDNFGETIPITNAITNALAGITWANKASGAPIEVSYTLTEFVQNTTPVSESVLSNRTAHIIPYSLGTTSANNYDITSHEVVNVLSRQGIYLFTFTDQAGNSTKYLFIVDRTENYFKITDIEGQEEFVTGSSLIFYDTVTISTGSHKAISLGNLQTNNNISEDLRQILALAGNNSTADRYASLGYYTGDSAKNPNYSAINNLFATISDSTYFVVANVSLTAYDDMNRLDSSLTFNISTTDFSRQMVYQQSNSTSMVRTFYLTGANNKLSLTNGSARVTIEINKDSSRGMVYYSNYLNNLNQSQIELAGNNISEANISRLYTGSDFEDQKGIDASHATSENYLAFTWYQGSDATEIESITYDFYMLGETYNEDTYYYSLSMSDNTIYQRGEDNPEVTTFTDSLGNQRAFAILNISAGSTREGLYVVSRTYVSSPENEAQTINYYFIVDRNGIIDATSSFIGSEIAVELMGEVTFNNFSSYATRTEDLVYTDNETSINTVYNLYLNNTQATKLPATIFVPISKYYNGQEGEISSYYSGRLEIALYFNDVHNQLSQFGFDQSSYKLFEITTMSNNFTSIDGVVYYTIDITQEITNSTIRNMLLTSSGDTSYLTLPGDYVLVINDLVESTTGGHEKLIGLRINGNQNLIPSTEVYATNNQDNVYTDVALDSVARFENGAYRLTTNKEYVKIDIPAYDTTSISAQVDNQNLTITQNMNGSTTTYLSVSNGVASGEGQFNYSVDDGGNVSILLNTYLREGGQVSENYAEYITYTITLYYKVTDPSAYYYYENGERRSYYQSTYTVTIDREPPKQNINALQEEAFLDYYTEEDMFETVYQDNGEAGVTFITRYRDYYSSQDLNDIYAFRVDNSTVFDTTDTSIVYVQKIDDPSAFTLADMFNGEHVRFNSFNAEGIDNFSDLFSGDGYYQIAEEDSVGNLSQYVVFYDSGSEPTSNIQLNLNYTGVNSNGQTGTGLTAMLGAGSLVSDLLTIHTLNSAYLTFNGEVNIQSFNDRFYRFELVSRSSGVVVASLNTNLTTDFASISDEILDLFNNAGYGNYNFVIRARNQSYSYSINYYEPYRLTVENLVVEQGDGSYLLVLNNANELVGNAYYYAREIQLEEVRDGVVSNYVYYCDEDNNYSYYRVNADGSHQTVTNIVLSGSYVITMVDSNYNEYVYRFSTEDVFYYSIQFGTDGEANSYNYSNTYYAFDLAEINYNNSYYDATVVYQINSAQQKTVHETGNSITNIDSADANFVSVTVDGASGRIIINPYFSNNAGGIITATVTLYNESEEFVYSVVLDTRIGSAPSLVDGENNITNMNFDYNTDIFSTTYTTTSTGTRYLRWALESDNEAFTFNYSLYEELLTGEYIITDLNDVSNATIEPNVDSAGVFRFVMEAYAPDGTYMGNVIYTFYVQAVANDLYTVVVNDAVVESNSSISIRELTADTTLNITRANIATGLEIDVNDLLGDSVNIPLYVFNQPISVRVADNLDKFTNFEYLSGNNIFRLYRIVRGNDVRYLATLQIEEYGNLVTSLQINGSPYNRNGQTFAGEESYTLTFTRIYTSSGATSNVLTLKNILYMDVYYYGEYVNSIAFADLNNSYDMLASGRYSIQFRDLAGNNAELTFPVNSEASNELTVLILREVAVSVNEQAPINNGYYNGQVSVQILNPSAYASRDDITVTYARNNGSQTELVSNNYVYEFTQPGWYRVIISAIIEGRTITRTLEFTIVNPNEAFIQFGLSNNNIEILEVLNTYNRDVTSEFLSLLNENNGMITYDTVLANATQLGITYGKQTFTVRYKCEDLIYPTREQTFTFSLNNEQPNIECDLSPGDSSTSGFTISFNAGEIYRQVGDCVLYIFKDNIGGTIVYAYSINADSVSQITSHTVPRESENSDGNYYVVLRTSSGNLISSFKVSINQPLNTFAIIIIVVVSIIVIAVVVTIIVLKKRMRIR